VPCTLCLRSYKENEMANKRCEHFRQQSSCKECKKLGKGGGRLCQHFLEKCRCRKCKELGIGGNSYCNHGRMRNTCKDCKGSRICFHGRQQQSCVFCDPEQVYRLYKRNAKKRKLVFGLSLEDFAAMLHEPCKYCKITFDDLCSLFEGDMPGIDRWDNSVGYTVENSVPCCSTCNWLKGSSMTGTGFIRHCQKVAKANAPSQ
jgi:hypothetical protein